MRVGARVVTKPAHPVDAQTQIVVDAGAARWVGRAAHKLVAALALWGPEGLSVQGRRCIDVGASTGGFTQVLLRAGAAHVVALDVGHDQLARELTLDPRVQDLPGRTIRGLAAEDVGGRAGVVVADLSFISLTLVTAELAGLLDDDGDLVTLVKPQFEVGRSRSLRHGVVGDPAARAQALHRVLASLEERGLHPRGLAPSPISGSTGNAEYLVWARSDPSDTMTQDHIDAAVRAATDHAPEG